jgi:hypothetical protein
MPCPYDALRDGARHRAVAHERDEPMIDLMAIAAIDRESEVTYIRRERDWATRAAAEGRLIDTSRMLPMLPPDRHRHPRQRTRARQRPWPRRDGRRPDTPRVGRRRDASPDPDPAGRDVAGIVTGIAVIMLLFLGQDWGDALFWLFAR